jgi:hypothetical protein
VRTVYGERSKTEVHGQKRLQDGTMHSRKKVKVHDIAEDSPSRDLNMTNEIRERLLEIATEEAENSLRDQKVYG